MRFKSDEIIAALDIGTNSFHLVIAKPVATGFEVVTNQKEVIRLGHGSGDMKQLDQDAMQRGIASLKRMREISEVHNAKLRAVATSAVREAENRNEFIKRARKEAGVEIEVISGIEEARLIHLGARHAIGVGDQQILLCDIGGGSINRQIFWIRCSTSERREWLPQIRSFNAGDYRTGSQATRF